VLCPYGCISKKDGLMGGMPRSQLAILPATTHCTSLTHPALLPLVSAFLDAPLPSAG
jgi:hypothetical protein